MAVARGVGAARFHYVGESLGGTLGLYLAIHHPDAIASVTTCSTAHRGGSIQRVHEWRAFIARHALACTHAKACAAAMRRLPARA